MRNLFYTNYDKRFHVLTHVNLVFLTYFAEAKYDINRSAMAKLQATVLRRLFD